MTDEFDALVDRLAAPDETVGTALQALVEDWPAHGPRCRALLHAYVHGQDDSERTERALFYIAHMVGREPHRDSFADLCRLARAPDRFQSMLGEDAIGFTYASLLISTFDGELMPLRHLVESNAADECARCDALMVLAYLTRTGAVAERETYEYLAGLPARLATDGPNLVWFGFARAVAALGFSGLSGPVETLIAQGGITPDMTNSAEFWRDLREAQQNPGDMTSPVWNELGPIGDPVEALLWLEAAEEADLGAELTEQPWTAPVRNPLRNVGRNDPCPCGSGKKYKKCCLQAEAT